MAEMPARHDVSTQNDDPVATVIELDEAPDLTPLLVRAARSALPIPGRSGSGSGGDASLPDTTIVLRGATIDLQHVADYAEVCGFRLDSTVPPTYLHMLGFPLAVQIMTRPDFPFGLMGLVHIANRITHHRPVDIGETLDVTVRAANLRPHAKGQQMDNVVMVTSGEETVWESVSTYLKRGQTEGESGSVGGSVSDEESGSHGVRVADTGAAAVDVADLPFTAVWPVPADIGRRYGAVSGDRNPIHLSAVTAKPFGFPKAIAHGMWTTARAIAGLGGRLPDAHVTDVAFKLPLLLPATVEYATRAEGSGWAFGVRSRDGRPHLVGTVSTV